MATLKEVIDSDPANAAKTDQQVVDWLNELIVVQYDITFQDLIVWASEEQIGKKTKAGISDEETTPGTWTVSVYNDLLVLDILLKSGGDIALSRDDVRTMINNLSGGGKPFSLPNKTALFMRSDKNEVRWNFHTADNLSQLAHVQEARNG